MTVKRPKQQKKTIVKQQLSELTKPRTPQNKRKLPIYIIILITFVLLTIVLTIALALGSIQASPLANSTEVSSKYLPSLQTAYLCTTSEYDTTTGCKNDTTIFTPQTEAINLTLTIKKLPVGSKINATWKYKENTAYTTISTQQLEQKDPNEETFTFSLQQNYDTGWLNGEYEVAIDFTDSTGNRYTRLTPINKEFTISENF